MRKVTSGFRVAGAVALASLAWAQDQDLSARDMFYSASDLVGKKAAVKASGEKHRTPVAAPRHEHRGTTVNVTAPLGLRYAILKRASAKQYEEVRLDTTFHAGDKIRLSVMSNEKGYLYIVQQGSSGTWSPLFPNPEINAGTNLIEAGRTYEIPGGAGQGFLLDENAGEEKLFIMLTRHPEPDLDKVVMSLREKPQAEARAIKDDVVQRLREQIGSRDLVFTKVDDSNEKEKAVYVVNTAASSNPNSRVVVDLKLNHK